MPATRIVVHYFCTLSAGAKYLIYALRDPRTLAYRYIGKSCSGLQRPRRHNYMAYREKSHKASWIRSLHAIGLNYEIVILEETTDNELDLCEVSWIARYRPTGLLTNVSDGGSFEADARAGGKASREKYTSDKRSADAKARAAKMTAEERRAISPWRLMTDEERKAKIQALKEAITPEVIAKRGKLISIGQKRNWAQSPDRAEALRRAWHAQSEEEKKTRLATMHAHLAAIPPERRSEIARKREAVKRAKRIPRIRINLLLGSL